MKIKVVKAKIFTLSIFLGFGLGFVILGATDYQTRPEIRYNEYFPAIVNENNKTYDVDVRFYAPDGIMENKPIYATLVMRVPYDDNSTTAEVSFPNARLRDTSYIEDPKVDRIASFHFKENKNGISTYESIPLLIYNNDGSYEMNLKIKDGNYSISKEYSDILQVDSLDDYKSEKRENESKGLTWIVIGIALISVAPTFITVVDFFSEYYVLKKNEMYE